MFRELLIAVLAALLSLSQDVSHADTAQCKCIPSEACWPTQAEWKSLNDSVLGQLIANTPVAAVCYPGHQYSASQCATVNALWTDTTFQQNQPLGYSYPLSVPCPPVVVSDGEVPGNCSFGNAPAYTVNATTIEHVTKGIAFAKKHNIRLVMRNTGHDALGRSTGYGSLQIWIRYLRTGITFHEKFTASPSLWNGSAFTIGGGYVWNDVYPHATSRGLVVVGGGTPTVGCIGGWMQGGGHSPATRDFGLGADQVLQAQIVLANGSLVTVGPLQHPDLFFAIRGGGPGTYGVVVSTAVKAWPTTNVVVQTLAFAPLTAGFVPHFMEALTDLYAAYPALSDGGWWVVLDFVIL
ncbi:hypothetical protein LTR50_003006 [Elasticomyces elasticus]|nr:hypothetical protein LTR50_003006 [Elasticomyces elasticus]